MECLKEGFDADTVPPSTGFDAIPNGSYKAVISESKEKPTKNGNGSYLELTFTIVDGKYENRKLWSRLNLNNPSDAAVGIARRELSAICHAVSVKKIKDASQLHDIPLIIRVTAKAGDDGELRNEIRGYEAVGTATKTTTAAATPPWKK